MKRPIFAVVVLATIVASLMAVAAVQANVIGGLVDIRPGNEVNSINPGSNGLISVAILTTADFDATTVDANSVQFGPGAATNVHANAHVEDVDDDGDLDILLHFRTQETGIAPGDTEACLTGDLISGVPIVGCDTIRTVP